MEIKKLCIFSILIIILSIGGVSLTSAFTLSPQPPVKGNILKVRDTCTPGSSVPVTLKFSENLEVVNGRYSYDIGTINIPTKSKLSIRAEDAKNLKIGVKKLIWFTITSEGKNGVATFSRTISGKHRVKVFGDAMEHATYVNLAFKARTSVECDQNGNLEYTYDSQYLPAGEYTMTVNDETKTVKLYEERPLIHLIANEIDYSLSKTLIEGLWQNNLKIERTATPRSCTLILGGPDAYNGTGEVVRGYLNKKEEDTIRAEGSRRIIDKGNVLIVAGSNRYMTHKAFQDGFEDVLTHLTTCLNSAS